MWVIGLLLVPALWMGWLVAGLGVWVLTAFSFVYAWLVPAMVGEVQGGVYVALVGLGVGFIGNLLMVYDFEKQGSRSWWWVDDILVWSGFLMWLGGLAIVNTTPWWLPVSNGRVLAAVMLAPLGMMVLSGIKSADDSGLRTGLKLLALLVVLGFIHVLVTWLVRG